MRKRGGKASSDGSQREVCVSLLRHNCVIETRAAQLDSRKRDDVCIASRTMPIHGSRATAEPHIVCERFWSSVSIYEGRERDATFSFIAFLSDNRYLNSTNGTTCHTMKTIISVILFLIFSINLLAQTSTAPTVGMHAPDFTLPYATKDSISKAFLKLSDFVGKRTVIVAFYPADWSAGCTKEVCTMRDNFAALRDLDAEILAISGNYVWSHFEWAKFHNLPFKLLSDHSHAVAKLYGSFGDKTLYNRRTIFVIDKKGTIAFENLTYSVTDLQDFEKLKSALASIR